MTNFISAAFHNDTYEPYLNTTTSKTEYRTLRVDWIIPLTVNLALIAVTTLVLISLIHYGISTGKWKGQSSSNADKLTAGIVYTFLIICAVTCIIRYLINQIFINAGFNPNEDQLCEIAGDAAFVSYAMVLWAVSMFLWFRQKAFYTNSMLAFKASRFIRAFSYFSVVLVNATGFAYILFFTIPLSYEASKTGCVYKANDDLRVYYGIYAALLIFISHMVLLCLFIYPVLQVGKPSKSNKTKTFCCWEIPLRTKPFADESSVTSNTEPTSSDSNSQNCIYRVRSLAVKPSSDGIKLIIRKTLIFAIASILLDIFISMISYFVSPATGNRRYNSMMFDLVAFANLLFLVFSFSTYKIMLTSCLRKKLLVAAV